MTHRPHAQEPGKPRCSAHPRNACTDVIAARLLALVLATVAPALHAGSVSTLSTSFITSDHVRLNVLEAGQGKRGQPTVAFVPGWSMPASIWSAQLEALSATHKVVALDPRGQGESDIPSGGYTT